MGKPLPLPLQNTCTTRHREQEAYTAYGIAAFMTMNDLLGLRLFHLLEIFLRVAYMQFLVAAVPSYQGRRGTITRPVSYAVHCCLACLKG